MTVSFQDGVESSAAQITTHFNALAATGQSVLDAISESREHILLEFEQGLSLLNSKRQRANRLLNADIAGRFLVSDFLDIDQSQTTAAVRIDSQPASLRERSRPADAVTRNVRFRSEHGSVEQFGAMYRVSTDDGTPPTGIFDIELTTALALTLVVFDIVSLPSQPKIAVSGSSNGVRYQDADQISRNGYRINAWLPTQSIRFLRIEITPTHPDTLGGNGFTFGLTNFSASAVTFI